MKHLRLATILTLWIFGLSLPAMAQTDDDFQLYNYGSDNVDVTLVVEKGRIPHPVSGSYVLNGKICKILGSYFPNTGRVKGRCQNDEGYLDVTGLKQTGQNGFQLTIGEYTYVVWPYSVEGTWQIEQRGGGRSYEGKLYLKEDNSSGSITGAAVWNNHQEGKVDGNVVYSGTRGNVTFTIYYSDNLEGYYEARLGDKFNDMFDGTARSNKGGPEVLWTAKRISRRVER